MSGGETLGAAVAIAAARLAAAGIEESRREARLLVALAIGEDPAIVMGYPERPLAAEAGVRLAGFVARRADREPLSRLRGRREFWSLDFELSPDTLDPRPDSETLIETALELLPERQVPRHVVDFGTGSGCLLLALLAEWPQATGTGIDISLGAVRTARRNAARLGFADRARFFVSDWDRAFAGVADVIVANPPYIPTKDIDALAPEVARFEPRASLDGGVDGLTGYRALVSAAARVLAPDGLVLFEVGEGQAAAVAALARAASLSLRAVRADLAGVDRCVACGRA